MGKYKFDSALHKHIEGLIQEKRAVGYKYNSSARILYKFDQFCLDYDGDPSILSNKVIDAWLQRKPNESQATTKKTRAGVVRQLALYMTRLDIPAYVLPKNTVPKGSRYTPYIFTDREIAIFLKQTDSCHYCSEVPLRHLIMPLLFRILYGCGLRISEALNLKLQDIDLDSGVLTIIDGKFNKDRLVPMSLENNRLCAHYFDTVHMLSNADDYFFPAPNGRITHGNVYKNF